MRPADALRGWLPPMARRARLLLAAAAACCCATLGSAPSTCLSSDADTQQCQDEAACASSTLSYVASAMSHCRRAGTSPWTAGSERTGDHTSTGDTRLTVKDDPATENSATLSACPAGLQAQIDTLYADCGGLTLATQRDTDWDAEVGPAVKAAVEACGCAGSMLQGGRPQLSLLVLAAIALVAAAAPAAPAGPAAHPADTHDCGVPG